MSDEEIILSSRQYKISDGCQKIEAEVNAVLHVVETTKDKLVHVELVYQDVDLLNKIRYRPPRYFIMYYIVHCHQFILNIGQHTFFNKYII